MPIFEIEKDGQVLEVDAPSQEAALDAVQGIQQRQESAGSFLPSRLGPRVTGRPLSQSDIASAEKGGQEIAAGIAEGGRRLVGGARQGLAYMQDTLSPPRALMLSPKQYDKATAAEVLRQVMQKQEAAEQGLNPKAVGAIAGATELGTLAIAPELIGPRALTMKAAMMRNAASGAAGAALQFDAGGDKKGDIIWGTALGPVLGFVPSLVPAAKNYLGRALNEASNNPRVRSALDAARRTLGRTTFSLAQKTQIPQLVALERASYNSKLLEFHAKQTDNLIADTIDALGEHVPAGTNLSAAFMRTRQNMTRSLKSIHANASQSYDDGMAEASRLSQQVQAPQRPDKFGGSRDPMTFAGKKNVIDARQFFGSGRTFGGQQAQSATGAQIPARNFSEQIRASFADARSPQPTGTKPLGEDWMRSVEDKLKKGHLTVQETADLLKQLTRLQKSEDGVKRAFGHRLRKSLETDLDLLEETAGGQTDDAIRAVIETRKEYKRAMHLADALADSAAYKLMGVQGKGGNLDVQPDQLLARFKRLGVERQMEVRNFLRETNMDMLYSMRSEAINDIVRQAKGPLQAAADSRGSFEALDNALFDSKKGVFRTEGLWDSSEVQKMQDIRDGLRLIVAERPVLKGPGTQVKSEDVAINLVSRHPGFVTRQVVRYLMSSKAADLFINPRVQEALSKVSRSTTGTPTNLLARAALLEILQDECGQECINTSN